MDALSLPASTPRVIAQPGGAVRFAVAADDGKRSASWIVWTSKNSDDVYLAARSTAGISKVSLHHTGSWQYGFTEQGARTWVQLGQSRHVSIWPRPDPFAPGFYKAFQIVVPDCELRSWPHGVTEPHASKVVMLPSAGEDSAACVDCFFAPDTTWRLDPVDPVIDVARLKLSGGGVFVVMARKIHWLGVDRRWLDSYRAPALASLPADLTKSARAPRMHFGGSREDGTHFLIDAAPDTGPSTLCEP